MTNSPELPQLFEDDINLNGLFDILNPENNLVLADDMMLSDAEGVILWVSENYEKNFGFAHGSNPPLTWSRTARSIPVLQRRCCGRKRRSPQPRPSTVFTKT